MKKRIIIFGSKGFISSFLFKFFNRNKFDVISLSSNEFDLTKNATVKKLYLFLKRNDILIFTSFIKNGSISKNILMVENLIKVIKKIRIKKIIYLSTDAVYDIDKMPIDEDTSCAPINSYGAMHLQREYILNEYFSKFKKNRLLILRLSNIFGSGHHNYGPGSFIHAALINKKIYLYGNGEEKRSHVYIEDLAIIIKKLLEENVSGIFNIASKKSYSFLYIARLINKCLNNQIEIINKKRIIPLYKKPYKWTQIFRFIYNLGKPITNIYHTTYDTKKLYSVIKKDQRSFEDNLIELINIYKKNINNSK